MGEADVVSNMVCKQMFAIYLLANISTHINLGVRCATSRRQEVHPGKAVKLQQAEPAFRHAALNDGYI